LKTNKQTNKILRGYLILHWHICLQLNGPSYKADNSHGVKDLWGSSTTLTTQEEMKNKFMDSTIVLFG
jgi:hypothetical protein